MSNLKAIQAYSNRNPSLRLVGNVVPGSRNFPHTVARLLTLAGALVIIGGAYQLIGGNFRQLVSLHTLAGMLCLTFVLSVMEIGFRNSATGFASSLLGSTGSRESEHFNERIGKWSMRAAHLWALLNIFHNLPFNITNIGDALAPAVMGYIYAVVFGIALPSRAAKDRPQFTDAIMPAACLIVAYYVYQYLMR